mgnify:CR=1 FL=1
MGVSAMLETFVYHYSGLSEVEIRERLSVTITHCVKQRYGEKVHDKIIKRIEAEWAAMEKSDTILDVALLYEFCTWLKKNNYPYYNRGTTGASFILWLLGITRGNPLSTHIYDRETKTVQFSPSVKDFFYLDYDRSHKNLTGDGHNIPWQVHWREKLDFCPTFYVDLLVEFEGELLEFFENHWLKKLRPEVRPCHNGNSLEFSNLAFVCIWKSLDFSDGFYENEVEINLLSFPLTNWRSIIEDPSIELPDPLSFSELVTAFGLSKSTGVYDDKVRFMVEKLGLYSHQIAFREDVFHYFIKYGYPEKEASRAMEQISFGKGFEDYTLEMMQAVDGWVLDRFDEVEYLFTRATAVEFILFQLMRGVGDV